MPHKQFTLEVPLKFNGFRIGTVTIEPDGTFRGKSSIETVQSMLTEWASTGWLVGIDVNFEYMKARDAFDMTRNQFESNEPTSNAEDEEALGNKPRIMLPPLMDGQHYEITDLPSGAQAVTIAADESPMTEDEIVEHMHKHDSFGRRIAGGGS